MAKISNRNTCAPPPPSFQQERRAGDLALKQSRNAVDHDDVGGAE
jgi:hypothetical protein